MVKYQLIFDNEYIFLNWIGKHTYGSCTIRGTCLHFQPSSAKFFHEENGDYNVIGSMDDNCNSQIDKNNVNPMKNFVPYSDDINELYNLYVDYFNKYKHEILKSHGYCKFDDKLLYIFKYEKIIQELHKVIQYANDNNVFQNWV